MHIARVSARSHKSEIAMFQSLLLDLRAETSHSTPIERRCAHGARKKYTWAGSTNTCFMYQDLTPGRTAPLRVPHLIDQVDAIELAHTAQLGHYFWRKERHVREVVVLCAPFHDAWQRKGTDEEATMNISRGTRRPLRGSISLRVHLCK